MRILGVDCGTERTGYGVVDSDGRRHTLVAAGVIRTSPRDFLSDRLAVIHRELALLVERHCPERFAVEAVFHAVNARSSLKLAHVRGVALLSAALGGLPVAEYSPLEIKASVTGYGQATKQQVQMMVASLLGLREIISPHDASDALAAAICDATRHTGQSRVQRGRVSA
jgi:crossover junction endodeoxyribonuclease RuvC